MRSCICLFYIALFLVPARAASDVAGDPDALYRDREMLASARQAAQIWDMRLMANGRDFESAWKLSRAMYWLGSHDDMAARRRDLQRGVDAGRDASMLEPQRPDGYFWMAANMGALAESYGLREGLRYRGPIKDALESVLRIDPAYEQDSADRALGRWYDKVPSLFGGSKMKSEEHLRKSLTYDPNSTASHFFLAETLFDMNRTAEAVAELRKVIAAPVNPEWAPEDHDFKMKAMERLGKEGK